MRCSFLVFHSNNFYLYSFQIASNESSLLGKVGDHEVGVEGLSAVVLAVAERDLHLGARLHLVAGVVERQPVFSTFDWKNKTLPSWMTSEKETKFCDNFSELIFFLSQ